MNDAVVDQEARDDAKKAIGLIEGHERVCSERWRAGHDETKRLRGDIKAIRGQFWLLISLLIGGQAAVIFLLAKGLIQ